MTARLTTNHIKQATPENFKGAITNISYNRKFICYPYNRNQIFFNISTTTKFQFLKGRFKMHFELESRERRESLNNMFMLWPVNGSLYQLNEEKMRVLSKKRAEQGKTKHSSAEKELFEYWGSRIATLSVTMTRRMKFPLWMISVNRILRKSHITLMMLKNFRFLCITRGGGDKRHSPR